MTPAGKVGPIPGLGGTKSTTMGIAKDSRSARLFSHLSASFFALLFAVTIVQFDLEGLRGVLVDALFRARFWKAPHPDVAIIAYDDASSRAWDGRARVPAPLLLDALLQLAGDPPAAVAWLTPTPDSLYTSEEMAEIGRRLASFRYGTIGLTDDESLMRATATPIPLPPPVRYLPALVSRDTYSYGADGVTRRVMITLGGMPSAFAELARVFRHSTEMPTFDRSHRYGETGPLQAFIRWQGPPKTYRHHSLLDVAAGNSAPGTFRDKIVLIGATVTGAPANFVATPYSRATAETSALEASAHSLATLLSDNALYRPPEWVTWVLSIVVAVGTVNLVLVLSPVRGILFVVGEIAALLVAAWVFLVGLGCWIDTAHPFIAAAFGYYLVIPYRLVNEYRQRWHYQHQSEMMAELEQLKSNFLSLVSHDLKTPVARIQGNAELLLSEVGKTNERPRKLAESIVSTANDLGEHIQTILDLARLEAAQVSLHKTSKDINATILEVVESKRTLAAERGITLTTKLEPIFSFKFDPQLIHRVIANLVENAVKYSPAGTEICLSSTEEAKWIRVSVADQGFGIPEEEQPRVFSKFYRCQTEASRREKGTGLGLYLVKYFVELHEGVVELKSEVGKGSVFTVALPI